MGALLDHARPEPHVQALSAQFAIESGVIRIESVPATGVSDMRVARWTSALVSTVCTSSALTSFGNAQATVPIRELSSPDATAADHFGNIFGAREIGNGRVLVNDALRKQLVVLDARLANRKVVLDSTTVDGQSYGLRSTPFIPYLADSTLFPDEVSKSLLVLDPTGKITRVASAPKPSDMLFIARVSSGVDVQGNMVYRVLYRPPPVVRTPAGRASVPAAPYLPSDSSPIVRANFETREVDTLAAVKMQPGLAPIYSTDSTGKRTSKVISNVLFTIDEWAMLTDGTLAIVRGHDYHVDVIQPDGKKISGPKLPFDFRKLTDVDKQKLLDSAKAAEAKRRADVAALAPPSGGRSGQSQGIRPMAPVADGAPNPNAPLMEYVPLDQVPDYYPSIRMGAAKADADGNMWILPTTSASSKQGELVYDVVNNRGVLIERVRMPVGRSVAGFGRGGVVYLMSKGSDGLWSLERTKIMRGK